MHSTIIVLNYSGFKHTQVELFCTNWTLLRERPYELFSPKSLLLSARYITLKQVDPTTVFGLDSSLHHRVVIFLMPTYSFKLQEAPKKLFDNILDQARVVMTTYLFSRMDDSLRSGRVTVYNSAYL